MASDKIYANSNTVTGSIGVIMSGFDMTGLYEKLGIRYFSITSGKNKDSSQMTDEQMAIYQAQVDEYYNKFVSIVAEGRGMSEEAVRELADGRTYTADQAIDNGLIDTISSFEDMQAAMSKELGVNNYYSGEPIRHICLLIRPGKRPDTEVRSPDTERNRSRHGKRGADVLCRTIAIDLM